MIKLRKLSDNDDKYEDWIFVLGEILSCTTLLFVGWFFLYWGVWNYLSGYGTRPAGLEYLLMGFGVFLIIGGIIIALYLGKKLKGRPLRNISLTYLIVTLALLLLDPFRNLVDFFMPIIILSNMILD
ncbi:MAG: hypothetical protein GWN31_12775, partial [Candidatus Thorarchaeota archaeon]|nr:hypothetical protein [Candidatus Thorarchaeota archaeon]NIW14771.1 hypothetical protein [Candidatus Thorarchaeota archaeon]NIW52847.1 hypothetical protein [Candidatus Korarchaeota archaeon]